MPEIAEVARVTHFLRQHLVGKRISHVVAQDDKNIFGKVGTTGSAFETALGGKRVVGAGNQGKYFWLELDSPPHPVMHLGMTGWIHIRGMQTAYNRYAEKLSSLDEEAWPPKFWKFHLETEGDPGVSVAFTDARRFGRVRLVDCSGSEIRSNSPLVENGPDPVVDREIFTEDYLSKKMKGRHVPIKALLLDQAMISGIGNWVGDEIMYQAGMHPEQYSDDFSDSEIAKLYKAICYVCDTAVEKLGDSDQFPEDWLFNHRWSKGKKDAAKTLPNGERLMFITVGGRTSCVVPTRQKKTGRVTAGVKEEEPEPIKKGKPSKQSSSYFNNDGEKNGDEEEQKPDAPAAKKARSNNTKKKKSIKKEDDENTSVSEVVTGKKDNAKTSGKQTTPPSDIGRRRSTRLSKIS
ncbi:formamidopyrimidine-DNA glycosylase [Xylaria bambusicola]|uniref:formamidopyrimidine-DNA glycosylase n=1 Tax=Xylaria bambusicola TaxID=326684 RepID=UPI0020078A1E|nr:formamidopyrimidine-DNA glycosylase [Xylaria bambusicola]KAI0514926.1 formamidopyrimidine-DNA glycosylase [Xylaria bambusicola]